MNRDGDTCLAAERDRGEQVLVERVNSACPNQSDHVQRAVVPTCLLDQLHERRNSKELARLDRLRNPHDILRDDAAGAEIQMAHFTVADLSLGKSDGQAGRFEQRARRALPQFVPRRRIAELDRVALAAGTEAPAVEHNQHNRGAPTAARCHIEGDAS